MELYDLTIPRHDKWAAIERRGVMSYCARGIAWVTVFFIALTALFLVYGMVMVQAPYLNAYSNPFTQMLRAVDLFPMI